MSSILYNFCPSASCPMAGWMWWIVLDLHWESVGNPWIWTLGDTEETKLTAPAELAQRSWVHPHTNVTMYTLCYKHLLNRRTTKPAGVMVYGNNIRKQGWGVRVGKKCCLGNKQIRENITHNCIIGKERDSERNLPNISACKRDVVTFVLSDLQ